MTVTSSRDGVRFSSPAGRWVLAATILGSGMAALDATVVNVALPAIGKDLHADVAGLEWVLTGYLLTLAALILVGGALGDRYGRRRVFMIGAAWFTVASVLCGAAPDLGALVGARLLQGIGGALLTPASLAIIEATFVPEDRGKAIGAWSGFGGVATAIGPFAGGWLISAVSWRLVFLLNVPLAAVVAVAARHVPESTDANVAADSTRRIDITGAVLGAVGLAGVTYGLIEQSIAPAIAGVAVLVAFVVVERRSSSPMVPLSIFESKVFTAANIFTVAAYAAIGVLFFLVAVELQQALRYSPTEAGAALLPITFIMLLLSARAGAVAQRVGPRLPMTIGPLIVGAGLVLFVRVSPGVSYVGAVLPAVLVIGLGLSATVAPLTATVLAAASDDHAGIASGVNNAVARIAGLLAIAVIPTLAGIKGDAYLDAARLTDGFHHAMWICAALVGASALMAAVTMPGRTEEARPVAQETHCCIDAPPLRKPAQAA